MAKLTEQEQRISALEIQMAKILDGETRTPASTDELEAEKPVTLNAPPKQDIQTRGRVLWVRRADEEPALSRDEWDSLRTGDNDE